MLKNQELSQSLPASIVNIEEKSRSNLFTWRGQFSPQLIESLLKEYASTESKVFDPFLGSGTVLYEAGLLGLSATGCEINPAAIAFAKVYELVNESRISRDVGLNIIERFVSDYTAETPFGSSRSIDDFESDVLDFYRGSEDRIIRKILAALIVGLDFEKKQTNVRRVAGVWNALRSNIEQLPYSTPKLVCLEADARKIPVSANQFDFVITSPPYINVFNYHQNYRKSVELLGVDVLSVARSEIGSNRKFRGNRFLTVAQYCMDMALVFEELKRVCINGAKVIFIVGRESNVRKTAFFNAELLKNVAFGCGMSLEGQQQRVFENKFGQAIYEEILRFKIANHDSTLNPIDMARDIGIAALNAALKNASEDLKTELLDAVEKAKEIQPSPFLGE